MSSKEEKTNQIFKAIADPTRRKIFHLLVVSGAALSLTQISEQFDISRQGVTKHVKLMHVADMIQITAQGRERYCVANLRALNEIRDWLAFYDKFWDEKLSNLTDFLDNEA